MEDNMSQVHTMVGNLRNMAIDMGCELEGQNKQIDRIKGKVILIFKIISYICCSQYIRILERERERMEGIQPLKYIKETYMLRDI